MRQAIAAEPDFKWQVTNSIEDGRQVALEWTWTSTYTGPDPFGKKVTNKRISGRGSSLIEIENGKIKRFTDYYDIASFFR
jgi:predicted ester cyclase